MASIRSPLFMRMRSNHRLRDSSCRSTATVAGAALRHPIQLSRRLHGTLLERAYGWRSRVTVPSTACGADISRLSTGATRRESRSASNRACYCGDGSPSNCAGELSGSGSRLAAYGDRRARQRRDLSTADHFVARPPHAECARCSGHHAGRREERDIGSNRSRVHNAVGPRNAHGHALCAEIAGGALPICESATSRAIRGGDQDRARFNGREARPARYDPVEPQQAGGSTAGGGAQQRPTENFLQRAPRELAGIRRRTGAGTGHRNIAFGRGEHELGRVRR